jgi:hypothetical protein
MDSDWMPAAAARRAPGCTRKEQLQHVAAAPKVRLPDDSAIKLRLFMDPVMIVRLD